MVKAILLIVVLGAVYFLWKAITEQKAAIEAKESDATVPPEAEAKETAECPVCKAYVSITAEGGCGREECPIPALAEAMAEEAEAEEPKRPAGG
jgi:hypothetical protein